MNSSQIEPYYLSSSAKEKGFSHCFVYRGLSMIPTFRNGDFLYTCSVIKNHISEGDVVVFISPDKKGFIVHRIMAISNTSFITCGDHNLRNDFLPITIVDIIGKVELFENKSGIRRLVNGRLGLWMARVYHFASWMDHLLRYIFWTPYNFIRERRFMVLLWRPKISRIILQIEGTHQIIKYLYNNRTIATWDPYCQHFECRKPFDLIISSPLDEPKASF